MMIPILISAGIILFAGGVFLVFKGVKSEDGEIVTDAIVPISDPKEIKKIKDVFDTRPKPEEPMVMAESSDAAPRKDPIEPPAPAVDPELLKENDSLKEEKEESEKQLAELKAQLTQSKEEAQQQAETWAGERKELEAALEQEVKSKEQLPAFQDKDKAESLAEKVRHAEGSMMRLNGENARLRRLVDEQKEMLTKFDKGFDAMATHNKTQKAQQSITNDAVQEELDRVKKESEVQSQKDKAIVDKFRGELEVLQKEKGQLEEVNRDLQQRQKEVEAQFKAEAKEEHLGEENVELRQQLQKSEVQIQQVQEALEILKLNYEQKLNDAEDEIYKLKNQALIEEANEGNIQISPAALSKVELEKATKELEQLRGELDQEKQNRQKLEEENNQLIEKDRLVEFELTKNRAQAHGLEQICEELKRKVEMQAAAAAEKEE